MTEEDFWRDEFDPQRPVPTRLEDLVIYELHVDGLGAGRSPRGMLQDAIDLLPYLKDLGVNAVELMPLAEYEGWASWGYGSSHYLAIEYAGGGRDQFKYFIRACHRHGIAVIMDVVYNHYIADAERAQWGYDSNAPERNIYYWYEGRASDYPGANPPGSGGYIDNMSTGWAPRFWEETVRKLFISSAAMLVDEFHVDGFRVDQTTSLHSYAVIHADGRARRQCPHLRRQVPARMDPHHAAGATARHPGRRGSFRLAGRDPAERCRRSRLRCCLVRRILSPADRRRDQRSVARAAAQDCRLRQ